MRVIITENYEKLSLTCANIITHQVQFKQNSVLGLATGSTCLGLYKDLIKLENNNKINLAKITTFNLDEYYGLDSSHPQSYFSYMQEKFFKHLKQKPKCINIPVSRSNNINTSCREYEEKIIACKGIDLQILGIGTDGHIGFNEPTSSLASRTRVTSLSQQTINDNSRFFANKNDVPKFVITMGIATILEAGICLLMASGKSKAKAVAKAIEGPLSANLPASALQTHQNSIFVIDKEAASDLQRVSYYNRLEQMSDNLPINYYENLLSH